MDKIEEYRQKHSGLLRLLSFRVDNAPPELGRAEQSITIDLVAKDGSQAFSTQFAGVQQLRIDCLTPVSTCSLQIVSIAADQLEGLHYKVFNGEQDLTLSFFCNDFGPTQSRLL